MAFVIKQKAPTTGGLVKKILSFGSKTAVETRDITPEPASAKPIPAPTKITPQPRAITIKTVKRAPLKPMRFTGEYRKPRYHFAEDIQMMIRKVAQWGIQIDEKTAVMIWRTLSERHPFAKQATGEVWLTSGLICFGLERDQVMELLTPV